MSFEDVESAAPPAAGRSKQDVAAGIFQIGTAVGGFRRLVDGIGTPKDSPEHRRTLHEARRRIAQLVKDTSSKLKTLSDANPDAQSNKKVEVAKLARDFQAVLLDFQKAQKLAVEQEAAHAMPASSISDEHATQDMDQESQQLLWEQKRQEVISLDNEAMTEEREQGIRDIQYDVGQINEIFRDITVLLDNQHPTVDDIDVAIEAASTSTSQARAQLLKGAKISKSKSSSNCWVLIIFVVVLTILLVILIVY